MRADDMNQNKQNKQRSGSPVEEVDRLLRAGAAGEVSEATGRIHARVMARLAESDFPAARVDVAWFRFGQWLLPVAAAVAMTTGLWLVSRAPTPAPFSEPRSAFRLSSALGESAEALRGTRPERALVVEAERLRADVERGVVFVKSVLPRIRFNG
jgi:hypothetical protein